MVHYSANVGLNIDLCGLPQKCLGLLGHFNDAHAGFAVALRTGMQLDLHHNPMEIR